MEGKATLWYSVPPSSMPRLRWCVARPVLWLATSELVGAQWRASDARVRCALCVRDSWVQGLVTSESEVHLLGPCAPPLLGGAGDEGASLALHASGALQFGTKGGGARVSKCFVFLERGPMSRLSVLDGGRGRRNGGSCYRVYACKILI